MRMSDVGLSRSARVLRPFGVYIHASTKNPAAPATHTSNDVECIALVQRWPSALDEHLANDNALAVRPLCVTAP